MAATGGSLDGLVQCASCHRWVSSKDSKCSECSALLPKGVAMREASGRRLPPELQRQRQAYERYKKELTHVPSWLRKLVDGFTYAYTRPLAHAIVQWGSGLLAFGMAFSAAEVLRTYIPPEWAMKGMAFIGIQLILGVAAFIVASRFVFAIFQKNVEAMLGVWGEEEDIRIMQGELQEQYLSYRKER